MYLMVNYTVRFAKRFAVLLPGIVIAYFAVRDLYPAVDKRVPTILAVFLTYVVTAYVLVPAGLRVLRFFLPARHLPLYCVTPDGFASDPINIGVIATRAELIDAMRRAGWVLADKFTPRNVLREVLGTLFLKPNPSGPMSRLYLFGRKQDLGFVMVVAGKRGNRHHVRFWATTYDPAQPLSVRSIHWHPRKELKSEGKLLWLGAASRDAGISFIKHNAQFTHMIDPDTDQERELILSQLSQQGATQTAEVQLDKPYRLVNRAWRGYLQTDGVLKVCELGAKSGKKSKRR